MNKNLLIKQNNELFNRINVLKSTNSNLNLKITKLNTEIEGYRLRIAALENEIQNLKSEDNKLNDSFVQPEEIIENIAEMQQNEQLEKEDVVLSDEFNYASDIIGNIVIKAAGYINKLTESSKENKKELINLVLGRTEIAKAEILNIISSEVSFESKKDLINTQFNEASEYFKSILEQ